MIDDVRDIMDLDFDPSTDEKFNAWSNTDNLYPYNNQPLGILEKFTFTSDISDNKDVDIIYDKLIKPSSSVLELGAGYGRVLRELITRGYEGKLSCVERDHKFCNILRRDFSSAVNIYCSDISTLDFNEKFDLILWMWSGFAEFSKCEQPLMLGKLSSSISISGHMVIDTIYLDKNTSENQRNRLQCHHIKTKFGTYRRYFPSFEEIERYAKDSNLSIKNILHYTKTFTNKKKCLYILHKGD